MKQENEFAMLSERDYAQILDRWLAGIASEISFWDAYMEGKGVAGSHIWEEVISSDRPFRLEEDLDFPMTCFLDAGSGPFSRCGFKTEKTKLNFTAVDALAPAYNRLKQKHGITSGVSPQFGFTEILSDIFPPDSFDIVHMSNSLDHCIDPILCLYNMLKVCKVGGKIILRHTKNEGVTEKYDGLHQWNLCVEDACFFIWRDNMHIDVKNIFGSSVEIETYEDIFELPERRWKYDKVVIHKHQPVEIPQNSFKKVCFEKLAGAVFSQMFEASCSTELVQRCEQYKKELLLHKQQLVRLSRKFEALAQSSKRDT